MSSRVLLWVVLAVAVVALTAIVLFPFLRARQQARELPPAPSAAGAWYEVLFTSPVYPDRAENRKGGLDERLVALIDATQRTLDVAIYDFDLQNVAQAMARAKGRGVTVRMVTDTDTVNQKDQVVQAALRTVRDAGIPIVDDQRRPIMHHKFVVSDGGTVLMGSWNFTVGDTYRLNNNAAVLKSPELAANFSNEFEKMFTRRQFGPTKAKDKPNPTVTIAGAKVETYFASEENPTQRIVQAIREARSSVDFLAFSFTHDPMGDALIERQRAGVKVRGVFETTGSDTRFSEYGRLKAAGLEVYKDGNPYVMHHKVFVIDGHLTVFGSFNFSDNAADDNDENLLIVDDPQFAQPFAAEFGRMLLLAQTPIRSR
ncbi:MAG TPA: phospholipase D-like domain-containing protein [Chloroflexota bacterium]|nr:phospholipase D-like domain-containing protein [Chloroflexota bacterium]